MTKIENMDKSTTKVEKTILIAGAILMTKCRCTL